MTRRRQHAAIPAEYTGKFIEEAKKRPETPARTMFQADVLKRHPIDNDKY
ncbi:MAG: hypothetical protein ACLUEV_03620 [Alistipes sp.]